MANTDRIEKSVLEQAELDQLLRLNGFLDDGDTGRKSLIDELNDAILDSGRLSLKEWRAMRDRLKEIERLIPTIDLIIDLKARRRTETRTTESGSGH